MYKVLGNDQKIYGPVSVAQIRQWQAEGRVNSATLLQPEGSNDWTALSSLPEFGVPPVVTMPPATPIKQDNGMAVAGLTFGILSNVCCCFGLICAILGITFSIIAISRHQAHLQHEGKGMAVAGLILSLLGLTCHFLLPLFFVGLQPNGWMWLHRYWRRW